MRAIDTEVRDRNRAGTHRPPPIVPASNLHGRRGDLQTYAERLEAGLLARPVLEKSPGMRVSAARLLRGGEHGVEDHLGLEARAKSLDVDPHRLPAHRNQRDVVGVRQVEAHGARGGRELGAPRGPRAKEDPLRVDRQVAGQHVTQRTVTGDEAATVVIEPKPAGTPELRRVEPVLEPAQRGTRLVQVAAPDVDLGGGERGPDGSFGPIEGDLVGRVPSRRRRRLHCPTRAHAVLRKRDRSGSPGRRSVRRRSYRDAGETSHETGTAKRPARLKTVATRILASRTSDRSRT